MVNFTLSWYLSGYSQQNLTQTVLNINKKIYKPLIVTRNQKQDFLTAQIYRNNLKFQQVYPLDSYDKREVVRKLANGWGK
jgi:hypothetical protein